MVVVAGLAVAAAEENVGGTEDTLQKRKFGDDTLR